MNMVEKRSVVRKIYLGRSTLLGFIFGFIMSLVIGLIVFFISLIVVLAFSSVANNDSGKIVSDLFINFIISVVLGTIGVGILVFVFSLVYNLLSRLGLNVHVGLAEYQGL